MRTSTSYEADQPRKMMCPEEAKTGVERLADRNASVVAYAMEFDHATEETEDPRILFRAGLLPRELAGED